MYKENPGDFNIEYKRKKATRYTSTELDEIISTELQKEKSIIEDERVSTVNSFNFHDIEREIARIYQKKVSYNTIRNKAIKWELYNPKDTKKKVYVEFERGSFGSLFQHDASIHKWSPFMEKFYLILTIDDHSRYIVYAKFFKKENTMNHIYALEEAIMSYGIPLQYYVDKHSIFTGHDRKSVWKKIKKKKEEFNVQFQIVCRLLSIQIITANSPSAKGKVERPFRYFQDILCRRFAKEEVRDLLHAQSVLDEVIKYYNFHKVHSITKEIPADRFNRSVEEKRTKTRSLNSIETNPKDIFCLHHSRSVDKFGRISYLGHKIYLPKYSKFGKRVQIKVRIRNSFHYLRIFANGINIKNIAVQEKPKSK